MGTLYIVGTPIGNLEDLTYRAARVLREVDLIAAEDTRVTRRLLNHLGIRVPLLSYHAHNRQGRLPELLAALESGDVALVTDAGMPCISDPGDELVSRAAAAGFNVVSVPAASAVTAALAVAGFPADSFLFLGFLPRRAKERRARLAAASRGYAPSMTLALFEAPHRLRATLEDLRWALGDREVAVCRELTKLHEEVFRGTLSQAIEHFHAPRGEFVIVVKGAPVSRTSSLVEEAGMEFPHQGGDHPVRPDLETARQQLTQLRDAGAHAKDAVATVARSLGLPRQTVYRLWLQIARPPKG